MMQTHASMLVQGSECAEVCSPGAAQAQRTPQSSGSEVRPQKTSSGVQKGAYAEEA